MPDGEFRSTVHKYLSFKPPLGRKHATTRDAILNGPTKSEFSALAGQAQVNEMISESITELTPYLVTTRRKFHAMPELSFQETATAAAIAAELRAMGLEVQTGIGKTGLTATLQGAADGPTLMVRADIDGLPLDEATGLAFASKNGAMHACGHDGHIAIALGTARALVAMRDRIRGRVVFVFQPAEEVAQGALAMLEDGLFDHGRPDRVIGLHIWNQAPAGSVIVNRGTVFASADMFRVSVTGKGGHGALPHLAVDPVMAAAQIITTAQTIVSREIPPNEMGVVTFGRIDGGTAPNVIANSVTSREPAAAYRPETRDAIHSALARIASGVAESLRAKATFEVLFGAPPVVNNPEVADQVARCAMQVVGEDGVGEAPPVSLGDDVSEFLYACARLLLPAGRGETRRRAASQPPVRLRRVLSTDRR